MFVVRRKSLDAISYNDTLFISVYVYHTYISGVYDIELQFASLISLKYNV